MCVSFHKGRLSDRAQCPVNVREDRGLCVFSSTWCCDSGPAAFSMLTSAVACCLPCARPCCCRGGRGFCKDLRSSSVGCLVLNVAKLGGGRPVRGKGCKALLVPVPVTHTSDMRPSLSASQWNRACPLSLGSPGSP